ncbi:MAG: hypothetical protein KJ550_09125 [Proteobacteria bacterium]|nr:hypothetical protein [Pseudomonadota bacterium]MBU4013614.1 hypothetical protein [Pseudomonadota bacterium]MBU4067389.1 hypothetical protein [Pseudomonadota bacterium]MBU4127199.1 hypothetical protein [Pseudomonadota bacterium]MBU4208624.1 hypothetical protein [Pseudomonadota bacterium]
MQPLFTIHAGEYLVGSHIEQELRDKDGNKFNVWVPSKDTGIDLLVTNHNNSKVVSIQVKFSKDFLVTHGRPEYQKKLTSCGWWTLNRNKIHESPADFWVFVLHTFNQTNRQYVIVPPKQLSEILNELHPNVKSLQTYLWVTASKKCWETRGLKKKETDLIVDDNYRGNDKRNFSDFLNNWKRVIDKLT